MGAAKISRRESLNMNKIAALLLLAVCVVGSQANGFTCAMCKKLLPYAGKGECQKECKHLWSFLQGSCDSICDTLIKDLPNQYPCAAAGFCPWNLHQVERSPAAVEPISPHEEFMAKWGPDGHGVVSMVSIGELLNTTQGRKLLQAPPAPGGNPFGMLNSIIGSVTGAWSSIVSAFKTSYSEQLDQTQFHRGWSKFKEQTKVFKGQGLHYSKAPEFFADIRKMISIPDKYSKDFDNIINFIQFFDKEFWSEHDTTFDIKKGGQSSHFTMMANNNQNASTIDTLFITCAEQFKLAPDVFVITQSHSYLGGIFSSSTIKFDQRPAGLSTEDLQFVSQYFLLLAYQEIALAENLPQPPDPGFGPPPPPPMLR